jgi:hypothetical protein
MFHDHNGDLRIEINPSNASKVSVTRVQDPILGSWIGSGASPIIASGPIFLSGGLYHFIVRIATVDLTLHCCRIIKNRSMVIG